MTHSFADVAAKLAGIVPQSLGWVPQAFWETTPAELAAIFQVREQDNEQPLTRAELARLMEREQDE